MGVTKCDACKEECICRVCAWNDRCKYAIRKDCRKCLECRKCESGFGGYIAENPGNAHVGRRGSRNCIIAGKELKGHEKRRHSKA